MIVSENVVKRILGFSLLLIGLVGCSVDKPQPPDTSPAVIKPAAEPKPIPTGLRFAKRTDRLCGEVAEIDGVKAFVPLAQTPQPMKYEWEHRWAYQIVNPETVSSPRGLSLMITSWEEAQGSVSQYLRVREYTNLWPNATSDGQAEYIVFGQAGNPASDSDFTGKIFPNGLFVVANWWGNCISVGNLTQLKTDYSSLRRRLVDDGLLAVGRDPLSLGSDHYGVTFIGMMDQGKLELRSDADDFGKMDKNGSAPKRDAFRRVYAKEEPLLMRLVRAGILRPKP